MRVSTVAIALFGAASVSASSLFARQSIPSCAIPCVTNADLGGCVATDNHCLCTNAAFVASTTKCIDSTCTGQDLADAKAFSQALCAAVGVTLSSAAATATASGSGSSSPSASATHPASSSATASGSDSAAAPAASASKAAALSNSANTFLGLAAAGVVALAL